MEEHKISIETAKLAKEKGFNLTVTSYYSGLNIYLDEVRFNYNDKTIGDSPMHKRNAGLYSAPTQSLLQKWLREVYNIQLCLVPIYGGNKIQGKQTGWLCYTPHNDEDFNGLPSISVSHYSYEDALEAGLQEALKLIK